MAESQTVARGPKPRFRILQGGISRRGGSVVRVR